MTDPQNETAVESRIVEPDLEKWERITHRLELLYGEEQAPRVRGKIERMIAAHKPGVPAATARSWDENDALLITYADTLLECDRSPLEVLHEFLRGHVGGDVTFLHVLPFYPSTSDDGFAVADYCEVREDFGNWDQIGVLAEDYRVVFDAVLNHVSASSRYVTGYLGGDPAYENFVIAADPGADLSRVVRPRDLPLLHEFALADGSTRWLWTTFSRDQVDLNFANPAVLLEILRVLLFYAEKSASMVRLDAIPYLWKIQGTSCVHLRQTHAIIKLVRDVYDLAAPDMLLLSETNVPHEENISYFGDGGDEAQMIYNFSLPPLVLFALASGDGSKLTRWAQGLGPYWRGCTYLNITATHDGIGMRPTEGILSGAEREKLVQLACDHGGDVSYKRNPDGSVTPYELNITYFDALNDPRLDTRVEVEVARFLVSQAIPMALKGVPGIYIHSLLATRNDHDGVARTGRVRSINRANLNLTALEAELADHKSWRARVLGGVRRMLQVRRSHPAFHPDTDQLVLDLGPGVFAVLRRCHDTGERVLALHNLVPHHTTIDRHGIPISGPLTDILTNQLVWMGEQGENIMLLPYQVAWLS